MAIEKDDAATDDFKKKLQSYQNLKEQYLLQKQELENENLEHFVIDISTTNDINDQNQFYIMAKDATDLLETENTTVLADTGYYNGTEIKNCIDDGMKVYIKKARANNSTKDNEFPKERI